MNKSLLRTLTIATWITAALGVLAASSITVFLILRHADEQAQQRIREEEANLSTLGLKDLIALNEERDILDELAGTIEDEKLNETIRIYEPNGHLVYSSSKKANLSGVVMPIEKYVDGDFYVIHGKDRQYLARTQSYQNLLDGVLWVEISTPRLSPEAILYETAVPSLIILLILVVVIFFSVRVTTRRILKPLLQNVDVMSDLDIEHLKSWVPLDTKDQYQDFVPYISKVNELIARIQSSLVNSQYMGRYIAHEVRTPLTIIQGEIENTMNAHPDDRRSPLMKSILEEVEKIEIIVRTILRLSSSEQKSKTYDPQKLPLRDFFTEILPGLQKSVQLLIDLSIETSVDPVIFADKELLKLLISNLLRNIEKHAANTPSVKISVKENQSTIVIELQDSGPGLPPDLVNFLNDEERYVHDRVGIGLVLCKQIASINGFRIHFSNLQPHGLMVALICSRSEPVAPK